MPINYVTAYAGIFSAVGALKDTAEKWVIDSFFSGIVDIITELFEKLADIIVFSFIDNFRPNMETFYNIFGGEEKTNNMFEIFTILAVIIAIILLVYNIIMPAFSMFFDVQQGPGETLIRFFVTIILIFFGKTIVQSLMDIGLNLWDRFEQNAIKGIDFSEAIKRLLSEFTSMGADTFLHPISDLLLGPIVYIIVSIILLKPIMQLLIEIIERYIILGFLYMFFPLGASTIVSKGTSQIFKSYIRMIYCQIFLLLVNLVAWTSICFLLMDSFPFKTLINFLLTYGLVKSFQKIDNYMRSMGLTVAQTAGNLLDTIGGSFSSALASVANASRITSSAGNLAQTFGSVAGTYKAVETANAIKGNSSDPNTVSRNLQNGVKDVDHVSDVMAKHAMNSNSNSINNTSAASMINLTNGGAEQTMNKVFGNGISEGLDNIRYNSDNSFSGEKELDSTDGSKAILSYSSQDPSPSQLANQLEDIQGHTWNETVSPISLPKGESLDFQVSDDAYSVEELATNVDAKSLGFKSGEEVQMTSMGEEKGYMLSGTSQDVYVAPNGNAVNFDASSHDGNTTEEMKRIVDTYAPELNQHGFQLNEDGDGLDWDKTQISMPGDTMEGQFRLQTKDNGKNVVMDFFAPSNNTSSGSATTGTMEMVNNPKSFIIGSAGDGNYDCPSYVGIPVSERSDFSTLRTFNPGDDNVPSNQLANHCSLRQVRVDGKNGYYIYSDDQQRIGFMNGDGKAVNLNTFESRGINWSQLSQRESKKFVNGYASEISDLGFSTTDSGKIDFSKISLSRTENGFVLSEVVDDFNGKQLKYSFMQPSVDDRGRIESNTAKRINSSSSVIIGGSTGEKNSTISFIGRELKSTK